MSVNNTFERWLSVAVGLASGADCLNVRSHDPHLLLPRCHVCFVPVDENDTVQNYRTAEIIRGNVLKSVSATGQLNAVVTVEAGSEVSGQI